MILNNNIETIRLMLQNKEIKYSDILDEVFLNIEQNNKNNAYITLTKEEAYEKIKHLKDAPLAGIPFSVKDNICTDKIKTTAGSKILKDFVPAYSSYAYNKCIEAGAIITGKTNLDEFGMGNTCESSYFGKVTNPHNPEYVAGGSSGGAAVSVALKQCSFALGSDTGGSIRLPSSYCGVYGIKPTYGSVSRYGLIAYASSFDQIGVMANSTKDMAYALSIITEKNYNNISESIKGMKIAIPYEYITGLDETICNNLLKAISCLKENGAICEIISIKELEAAVAAYYIIAMSEASSNLLRYDGVKYGYRTPEFKDLHEMYKNTRKEGFGFEVRKRILMGTFALSQKGYEDYYLKALSLRQQLKNIFKEIFDTYDIILSPVSPNGAPKVNEKNISNLTLEDDLNDMYTVVANITNIPAASVPFGFDKNNIPCGIQLMAGWHNEAAIFSVSSVLEKCPIPSQRISENAVIQQSDVVKSYKYKEQTHKPKVSKKLMDYSDNIASSKPGNNEEFIKSIGLEVHIELSTKEKLFCKCKTKFGEKANTHTCPICMGMPGALPFLNKEVVTYGLRAANLLNCTIDTNIRFDRKNYMYPDNPQNYQITQFYNPIGINGYIDIPGKRIRIREIHIEEDAGKLFHRKDGLSYIDFNRAGIPLIEIVTMPDMNSSHEVIAFLEKLKDMAEYAGLSDCKLNEGSMRVDINLSVAKNGFLGTRTEMKNLNSFKSIRNAIETEAKRQIGIINNGGKVFMETRGWNEDINDSFVMRTKEDINDYRYFPEPDLKPFVVNEEMLEEIINEKIYYKEERIYNYITEYNLSEKDAMALTSSVKISDYFENTVKLCNNPKRVCNWILGDIMKTLNEEKVSIDEISFTEDKLAELITSLDNGSINNITARDAFVKMYKDNISLKDYIAKYCSDSLSEDELNDILDSVIASNEKSVNDYKNGKKQAVMYLLGQVMKQTKGKANPNDIREKLEKKMM